MTNVPFVLLKPYLSKKVRGAFFEFLGRDTLNGLF